MEGAIDPERFLNFKLGMRNVPLSHKLQFDWTTADIATELNIDPHPPSQESVSSFIPSKAQRLSRNRLRMSKSTQSSLSCLPTPLENKKTGITLVFSVWSHRRRLN